MNNSTDLINKRSLNYAFKDNISSLMNSIKLAYEALENPVMYMSESYIINEELGDKGKLKQCVSTLNEKYDILNTLILPAVDTDISGISANIEATSINKEPLKIDSDSTNKI